MSRIIYGFSGEGSGHATRTREMAEYLRDQGHELKLASYDRGYAALHQDFDVVEIEGLTIASSDNRVSVLKTIRDNLKRLPEELSSLREMNTVFNDFKPDVVVCDFEPLTGYLAEHFDVPLITVDNQHNMRFVKHELPPQHRVEARLTRGIVKAMVPWPSVSLIISFVDAETTNDYSFVFPPIVSRRIRDLETSQAGHTLVYLTSGFDSLLPVLQEFPEEQFFVYGYDRHEVDGNLHFFPKSQVQFANHLASANSVIATAGFTLMSEALFLRKPYLALPMQGQYEQELNAWQLTRSGYGLGCEDPGADAIGHFLYRREGYRQQLEKYPNDDGTAIKQRLGELVADDAKLARQYKNQRHQR